MEMFFSLNGKLISCDPNSYQHDTLISNDKILLKLSLIANKINSPYMTIDIVESKQHEWIILEIGDGGVSGPSTGMNLQNHWLKLKTIISQN